MATSYAVGSTPMSVAVGDFSGRRPARPRRGEWRRVHRVRAPEPGRRRLRVATNFEADYRPASVAAGDVSGDGQLDWSWQTIPPRTSRCCWPGRRRVRHAGELPRRARADVRRAGRPRRQRAARHGRGGLDRRQHCRAPRPGRRRLRESRRLLRLDSDVRGPGRPRWRRPARHGGGQPGLRSGVRPDGTGWRRLRRRGRLRHVGPAVGGEWATSAATATSTWPWHAGRTPSRC